MASYGRLAKLGAVWSVVRELGGELLSVATSVVMARLLTPHEFGVAAAATFFTQMAARITKLGLNFALVQQKEIRDDHASSVFGVSLLIGILSSLFFFVFGPYLGRVFHSEEVGQILPVAGVSFVIVAFNTVPSALMYRRMMFRQTAYVDWLTSAVSSVSMITLASLGFGFWSIVYAQLLANVAEVIGDVYVTRWRVRFQITRQALSDLFAFGTGIYAKRLLDYGALNLDNLVVGRVLGVTMLGFYDKAFSMMNRIVNRASLGSASATFRIFALMQDEPLRFRRAYQKTLMTVCLVGYPALTAGALMGHELFLIMFGAQWVTAVPAFQILCVAGMMKLANSLNSVAVQALGRVWSEVWRQLVYVALIVVFVSLLSPWGLPGAAVGVTAASAVMLALMFTLMRQLTHLSWREVLSPHVPGLACSVAMFPALVVARNLVLATQSVWILFAVQAAVAAVVFFAFLFWGPFAAVRALVTETIQEVRDFLRKRVAAPDPSVTA